MRATATPISLICVCLALFLPSHASAQADRKGSQRVFVTKGKDSKDGSFRSRITVERLGSGKLTITRTVRYPDGSEETLSGPARRAKDGSLLAKLRPTKKGIVPALRRSELLEPTRRLKISIDEESGFCVVRSWTRTGSSRAQGMRAATQSRLSLSPVGKRSRHTKDAETGEGQLHQLKKGERTYTLTRTEIVEHTHAAKGLLIARKSLAKPASKGARIVSVDDSGRVTLSIPGRGLVVLKVQ